MSNNLLSDIWNWLTEVDVNHVYASKFVKKKWDVLSSRSLMPAEVQEFAGLVLCKSKEEIYAIMKPVVKQPIPQRGNKRILSEKEMEQRKNARAIKRERKSA